MSRDRYSDNRHDYYREKDSFYRDLDQRYDNFSDDSKWDSTQADLRSKQARQYFEAGDKNGFIHYSGGNASAYVSVSPPCQSETGHLPTDPYAEIDYLLDAAERLFGDGNDETAEPVFSQTIPRSPNLRPASNFLGSRPFLGSLPLSVRNYAGGIDEHDITIARNSLDSSIEFEQRGHWQYQLKNVRAALSDYSEAIRLGLDSASIRLARARCYLDMHDSMSAIMDCNRAIQLDPENALAYLLSCNAKRQSFYLEGALNDVKKSIQLDSKNYLSYYFRGKVYQDLNRIPEAIRDFETCYYFNMSSGQPLLLIGQAYQQCNNHKEALIAYQRAEIHFNTQNDVQMRGLTRKLIQRLLGI